MIHEKLEGLMTPVEKIARVANAGLIAATTPQTSPSGAISLDNADGTRTIIGEVSNGEDNPSYTMATHVGDTTPPGIPTGITATSKSGVVVVEWDGTLSGGIPDDFYCVRVYLDGAELGALSEAGSVASAKLQSGTTHQVTATSEDDCCLPDGTPAHNVSDATQAISVTVAKDASEVMADIDEQIEGVEQEIADFKSNTYTKAQTDKKVQDLDDEISTELTTHYYNKTQIDTNYATKTLVSQTKEEIELSASQTYATKGESQPNLSPFFAHDLADIYNATSNPDGYFAGDPTRSAELGIVGTQLPDGWLHVEMDNSARTGNAFLNLYQRPFASLEPSTPYTLLIELRNFTKTGANRAYITSQADTSTWVSQTINPGGYDDITLAEDAAICKALVTKPDMSASNLFCRQTLAVNAGVSISFDLRLSLYKTASPEILLDANAPTLTKVDGPFDRYISDAGNSAIVPTYGEIADPPEGGEVYGLTLDYDGSYTNLRARALVFYTGPTSGDARPQFMKAGKQYQATWWARVVSGAATGRTGYITTTGGTSQPTSNTALAYTTEWRRYTASLRPSDPSYSRLWFYAYFPASTAGKVEMCGFSLREMDATFKPYVTDQTALSKEYSTKAELTVGLDGVRSEVSETYSTKQQTADAIEAIQVGGRNLITLAETYNGSITSSGGDYGSDTNYFQRRSGYIPATAGETYQMQVWGTPKSGYALWCCVAFYDSSKALVGTREASYSDVGATHHGISAVAPSGTAYMRVAWTAGDNGHAKLEQGTLPTDYTEAPEDLEARPNLTPFGSHDFADVYDATANPDGYWKTTPQSQYFTQLDDGWVHVHIDNSAGTGTPVPNSLRPRQVDGLEGGELVTLLLEVRNNQSTTTGTATTSRLYVQGASGAQLYGNAPQTANLTNDSISYPLREGESFAKRMVYVVDTTHLPASGVYGEAFRLGFRTEAGVNLDFELRASMYRGGYEGGYVPYSIEDTTLSKTYTKSSTFTQTVDGLDGRITATEDGLAVQETLIRQYAGGVLVAYVGNSVGILINAAGKADIVNLTWSGNEPTVGTVISTYGTVTQIGADDGVHLTIDSNGITMYDGATEVARFAGSYVNLMEGNATFAYTGEGGATLMGSDGVISLVGGVNTRTGVVYSGFLVRPKGSTGHTVNIHGATLGVGVYKPGDTGGTVSLNEYPMHALQAALDLITPAGGGRAYGSAYDPAQHKMKIACGSNIGSAGSQTITHNMGFAGVAAVIVSGGDDVGLSGSQLVVADSVGANSFEAKRVGGSTGNWRVNWVAIGWVAV